MPFTIRRIKGGEPIEYEVYTQSEADEVGIEYVHWKDAEPGDWALSDDGFVGKCLKRGTYESAPGKFTDFSTFVFARKWVRTNSELNVRARLKKAGAFYHTVPMGWEEVENNRPRTDVLVEMAARLMADKGWLSREEMHQIGMMCRPDLDIPYIWVRKQLNRQEVRERVYKELGGLLDQKGLGLDRLLEQYRALLDDEEVRDSTKARMLKDLMDYHNVAQPEMPQTKSKRKEEMLLEDLETSRRIKATRTTEVEHHGESQYVEAPRGRVTEDEDEDEV